MRRNCSLITTYESPTSLIGTYERVASVIGVHLTPTKKKRRMKLQQTVSLSILICSISKQIYVRRRNIKCWESFELKFAEV